MGIRCMPRRFGAAHADLAFISHDAVLFKEGIAALDEVPELIVGREPGRGGGATRSASAPRS